jgi:two-component system cell cycle response regulator DivK
MEQADNNRPAVLYVEDEPLSRQVMEMLLVRGLGFKHLTIFEDSRDIVARIKELTPQPEVVLLDIHLRPHDGFEVLSMLRAHEGYRNIKVVACTASVMNEEIDKLREADFNGCLGKPIDAEFFPEFLSRIIKGERVWHAV